MIYCSISGFSNDGPYRDRPAFDTNAQALSGMLHLFLDPERPRVRGPTVADQATALQAASAVVAALYSRERSGAGARIEVSMLDAAIAFMPDAFTAFAESGTEVGPETRSSYSHSFVFRCEDGKMLCVHVGGAEHFWQALVEAAGGDAIGADRRFAGRAGRVANFPALVDALAAIFRDPAARRVARAPRPPRASPLSEVHSISGVLEDPEVRHSGLFDTAEHPVLGPLAVMRRAARIDGLRDEDRRLPPALGEHTGARPPPGGGTRTPRWASSAPRASSDACYDRSSGSSTVKNVSTFWVLVTRMVPPMASNAWR